MVPVSRMLPSLSCRSSGSCVITCSWGAVCRLFNLTFGSTALVAFSAMTLPEVSREIAVFRPIAHCADGRSSSGPFRESLH